MDAFFGYAVISLMGVCLGMIGAGGSILALPVLVYLFRVEPTLATTYTSILVGLTAAVGALRDPTAKSINVYAVLFFGLPCIVGACLARVCLITIIPDVLVAAQMFTITRDSFVMLIFSITMISSGLSMLLRRHQQSVQRTGYRWLVPVGFGVGLITGIVGAGGGFLILPSLVILAGLEIRSAVGTSLTIIAMKSAVSFVGDLSAGLQINFQLIASLMAVAIPSVLIGRWLNSHVQASELKTGFAIVVSTVGIAIGIHNLSTVFGT
ncbi:sulfite exporter TauE/SafE family protein [Chryseolinea sp. T2]|uniref:sulfite exporter TauE/SafE family protein n=1 Tax=Chryseolinea sp. T2 TaxID=3129255 RepID=UPI003077B5A1